MLDNSQDRFVQLVNSLISQHIGAEYAGLIKNRLEAINEKQVCIVDVDKAQGPVYLKTSKGPEFFIRMGNTTRPLNTEQTVSYVNMHWG